MEKSFFGSLFDSSFNTFITRSVAKVFYIISIILVALGAVLSVIAGLALLFTQGDIVSGLIGVVVGPILSLLVLILLRLIFESAVALVLIAENTRPKK